MPYTHMHASTHTVTHTHSDTHTKDMMLEGKLPDKKDHMCHMSYIILKNVSVIIVPPHN